MKTLINFNNCKKLIGGLSILICSVHFSMAQTNCPVDTLNWPFVGNDTLYTDIFGCIGYNSGHNNCDQTMTGELISNVGTISVSGALIWFGHVAIADSTSLVTVILWDSSGTDYTGASGAPGNILGMKDLSYATIASDVTNGVWTEIMFDNPVTVTDGFYLGVYHDTLDTAGNTIATPGDTIAIFTNTDGETVPASAWAYYPTFNGWWNFKPDWDIDVSLAISPIASVLVTASFTASADTIDLAVSGSVLFANASTGGTGQYWDFGDGDTSSAISPTHIYTDAGTYTVTLASSLGNCADTVFGTVVVINSCLTFQAGFTQNAGNIVVGDSVTFSDTTTGSTGWYWDFGDGDSSNVMDPSHVYNNFGTFSVTFVAMNSLCADSAWGTVTVSCPVFSAGFTQSTDSVDLGSAVTFSDTTTGATNWSWDFGDGDTSTAMSLAHTYNTVGTFTVQLITWVGVCVDTAWGTVTVSCPVFSAGFTQSTDSVDLGSAVTFSDTTTGATNWSWDFGDGDTSTAVNPTHIYTSVGTYTVTLVSSLGNCADTVLGTVIVINSCLSFQAGFTQSANNIDVGTSVSFNDTTTGSTNWYWDFGDGDTSTVINPNHVYDSLGTFTIQLITWVGICSDTVLGTITVNDTATGVIELGDVESLSIFPNPTDGIIHVKFNAHKAEPLLIKVYDLNGRLIFELDNPSMLANGSIDIDLSTQAPGSYFVQLVTVKGSVSRQVNIIARDR